MRWISAFLFLILSFSPLAADDAPLNKGERIQLRIVGVPADDMASISGDYTISAAGKLSMPYLEKEIAADGVLPSVLAKTIEAAYRKAGIYTKPRIIINVGQAGKPQRVVSVAGEVREPGDVAHRTDLTISQAIAKCRGFTDFAKTTRIRLVRSGKTTIHNLKKVSSNPKEDAVLKPGDQIIVP